MTGVQTCALPISSRGTASGQAFRNALCPKRGRPRLGFERARDLALRELARLVREELGPDTPLDFIAGLLEIYKETFIEEED